MAEKNIKKRTISLYSQWLQIESMCNDDFYFFHLPWIDIWNDIWTKVIPE